MQTFFEKRAPVLISVLFHVVLLLFLWIMRQDVILPVPAQETPILMQIVMPPEPASAAYAPVQPQVQRTSPNPSEEPNPLEPTIEPESDTQDPVPEPAKLPAIPETPREEKVASAPLDDETIEQWRKQLEELEAQRKKTRSELETVSTVVVAAPGAERPYASSGADHGTVRELNIAQYPKQMQERFMYRYKIRIRNTNTPPPGPRSSFVNAAKTHAGTYRNVGGGHGPWQVMTLSREVQYRMAELELGEILKRKMVPERTRVQEIEFGLCEDEQGRVDLCVTRFRATPIE